MMPQALPRSQPIVSKPQGIAGQIGPLVVSSGSGYETPFEIWLIHGLNGDREKTWTHDNGTFVAKLLAKDFPDARVVTFGYDARIIRCDSKKLQNASSEGLRSHGQSLAYGIRNMRQGVVPATCPIYFIAHSLGGLVVEQALLICIGADKSLHDIATATAGIVFLGTPHQGSRLAKWSAIGKLMPSNIRTFNQKPIDVLREDSEICISLEDAFQEHAKNGKFRNIKLFSFYETVAMNGLSKMVVPEASAVLRGDFKSPIHGTHTSMARFEGPDDDGYRKIKGQLIAWLQSKPPAKAKEKQPTKTNGKRKEKPPSIKISGPTFQGSITKSTIIATQNVSTGDMFYYSGDRPSTKGYRPDGSKADSEADFEADAG